jgi:hypothetical protein
MAVAAFLMRAEPGLIARTDLGASRRLQLRRGLGDKGLRRHGEGRDRNPSPDIERGEHA